MGSALAVAFDVGTRLLEDASTDLARGSVSGTLRGVDLVLRLTSRGAGSSQTSWTEIDVLVPLQGVSLELRPQTEGEVAYVERGLAVDLVLGERRFDATFVVEAAPADIVRELLTRAVCARLVACQPLEVKTVASGLSVAKEGWVEDVDTLESLLEAAAELGQRAQVASRAADSATPAGASYRGARAPALETGRREELDALELVKERRRAHEVRQIVIVLLVVVLGSAAILVLVALFGHAGSGGDDFP